MIKLYVFGPAFGLPDPSPFCMKGEMLLKLARLPYEKKHDGLRKAPKGKLPFIEDDGVIVADSTLIRDHIERKYAIDLDTGLSPAERATAWALQKMCEDHLYWTTVRARWLDDENFAKGPAHFFDPVPAPLRPLVRFIVRRKLRSTLHGQGLGRHDPDAIASFVKRDIDAIAALLGEKPYVMGETPTGVDATVFAFVASGLCPLFEADARRITSGHANLVAYHDRMMRAYFPDFLAAAEPGSAEELRAPTRRVAGTKAA